MRITRQQRAQIRWALEWLVTVTLGALGVVMTAYAIRSQGWLDIACGTGVAVLALLLCALLLGTRARRWPDRSI